MDSLHSSTNSTHASDLGFFITSIVRNFMFLFRFIVMAAAAASNNAVEILVSWIINSVSHYNILCCCSVVSKQVISRKIWQNEQSHKCAKSDASFPRASSSPSRFIIDSPDRKVADAPPNANFPHQNVNPNGAGDGEGANNDGIRPNVDIRDAVMNAMGGNDGGNGDGGDSGDSGGGGGEGSSPVLIEPITIYRYTADHVFIETIETEIIADNYGSLHALAEAILQLWQQRNENANPPEVAQMHPSFCWPGSIVVFARHGFGAIHNPDAAWETAREQINCVRLYEFDLPGTRPITIDRYDANAQLIETFNSQIIANEYDSWNALAEAVFQLWQQRNPNVNAPEIAQMNPDLCWPGSMTVFGLYIGEDLTVFDQAHNAWNFVRVLLHSLQLFEEAQHGNEEGANNGIGSNDGAHGGNDNGDGGDVGEGNGDDDDDDVVQPNKRPRTRNMVADSTYKQGT